ncbi:methionyl-tRNA formyltransferase [Ureaplasma parvum]|uniref:methionyl-tRNA formyltransferase n=1 Tax=Ureaplasma parvum TaxID=134821 RepID=UPI001EED0C57|nr:methionyl-tRNA formyltransferase [Ureaplasma parvum]UIU28417.1 methionyl-tRNA formyltransferase [Ureaplasma parvum]
MKYKVMFFGTPEIAKIVLETLFNMHEVDLIAVVSQPDAHFDRKKNVIYSPVKQFCLDHNIKLFQPEKIKEIEEEIRILGPDIIITCAFGQFINRGIIDIPKYKIVNIHASLLPKLRGGAPIHYAILNGELKTGITLMHTIKKMDAGNILFQRSLEINDCTTTKSLTLELANLSALMIKEHFLELVKPNLVGIQQDENSVSFAYNIQKDQNIINFDQPAFFINRFVNAMYDKPIAIMQYNGVSIKVYQVKITNQKSCQKPGTIMIFKNQLFVSTQDFDIELLLIQLPNKKPLSPKVLLNGKNPFIN